MVQPWADVATGYHSMTARSRTQALGPMAGHSTVPIVAAAAIHNIEIDWGFIAASPIYQHSPHLK